MKKSKLISYQTDDVEERGITCALHDLFTSVATTGSTEDPLVLVCRSLVRHVEAIRFAFFCYAGDETGCMAAEKPNLKLNRLPPEWERKFVAHIWSLVDDEAVAVIPWQQTDALLTPHQRKKWKQHSGIVVRVMIGARCAALLAVFVPPDHEITPRHCAWMTLVADAASAFVAQREILREHLTGSRAGSCTDESVADWVRAGFADPRIKAVVGIRGSDKRGILKAACQWACTQGVSVDRIVNVQSEDARLRRFKSAEDVMQFLNDFPRTSKPKFLFLDEVGLIARSGELLARLAGDPQWNVWLSTSSASVLNATDAEGRTIPFSVLRTWANPFEVRPASELERLWSKIFMRDIPGGMDHPDIRTIETLSECYSDHLGEAVSLRQMGDAMQAKGRKLALASIQLYRQALVDVGLIETAEVYDAFAGHVVKQGVGRTFYMDLELRAWRYGSVMPDADRHLAINRLYLELRRTHEKVYVTPGKEGAFVTLNGKNAPRLWPFPEE